MDIPINIAEHSLKNVSQNTEKKSSTNSNSIENEEIKLHPKVIKDENHEIVKLSETKTHESNSIILLNTKNRKGENLTVNLYQFVNTICLVLNDTKIDNINDKFIIPNNLLKYFNNNHDQKNQKLSSTINNDEKMELKNKHKLMLILVIQLMSVLEKAGAIFQFSKEALKFYLATYSRFIVSLDFFDTNKIVYNNKKKDKNSLLLPLGGLLLEYIKGLDSFISNISRGDKTDVLAFKLIINKKIELSINIYDMCNIKFNDVKYEINIDDTNRDGYVKISTSNLKRVTVLITNSIIMMYDGHQFVLPPISMEKYIQMNMIIKSLLTKDEYILLDILLSAKMKVLDIIDADIKNVVISENYQDRLKFLINIFPDLKIISITSERVNTSYIQKKLKGHDVSYIYHKPNCTGAIIGTYQKNAYVAFKENDDTLIVKAICNISGPIIFNLTTALYQKINTNFPVIMFNDKYYKIVGVLNNVDLLKIAIPVVIKDFNKLGNKSKNDISNVGDYKSPGILKDTTVMENLKQALVNPDNTNKLIDIIKKSSYYDAIIQGLINNKSASIEVDFGDY